MKGTQCLLTSGAGAAVYLSTAASSLSQGEPTSQWSPDLGSTV